MNKAKAKRLTFDDLDAFIKTLTPEQRAMEVMWNGEDRGGFVYQTLVLDDDQVNPSGDGWEDRRNYIRVMMEEEGEGEEVAAAEPIVARKGQPFFGVDAW